MPDYKALYYQSQAALANAVEALTAVTEQLRREMQRSEQAVLEDAEDKNKENG